MKHIIFLISILLGTTSLFSQTLENNDVSTFYFIRHAEKDRSDPQNKNPHLNNNGKLRAQNWNTVLSTIEFDAVYSTNYNRTKETAQPTATHNTLALTLYDPNKIDAVHFMEQNKGKTVLIVGHSNTTPNFVNAIIGDEIYDLMSDKNNGNLYIITVINTIKSVQVLHIN
ncbi:SixA phosphatase family protein [Lacinutrix undariae]